MGEIVREALEQDKRRSWDRLSRGGKGSQDWNDYNWTRSRALWRRSSSQEGDATKAALRLSRIRIMGGVAAPCHVIDDLIEESDEPQV